MSALALLAFAAAALVARRRIALGGPEVVLLVAFAALTSWTAASALWSDLPSTSLLEAERTVVYLSAVIAFVLLARRGTMPQLVCGVVASVTLVCAYALVLRAFDSATLDPVQGRLLYKPVGYANALGILAALAIVLAVGLALSARTKLAKISALVCLPILFAALYFTSSRGGWAALAVGLGFGLWRGSRAVPAAVLVPLVVIAVVAAIVIGSAHGQGLALGDENRPHYWRIALDDAAAHPVLGSGAGTYGEYWLRHEPLERFARDAHSLYVESLAELGPLGLILVVTALAVPLMAIRRGQGPLFAAVAGAYVAFLVHVGIDWDWEVPAVSLAGITCGVALLVGTRRVPMKPIAGGTRWALGAVLLGLIGALVLRLKTGGDYPL